MKSIRDDFLSLFVTAAEGLSELKKSFTIGGGGGGGFANSILGSIPIRVDFSKIGNLFKRIAAWLKKPKNRTQALLVLWVFLVFVLFIITAMFVFALRHFTGSYKPGICIATFLWAFFFGVCILFFLPSKLITTMMGGLAGVKIAEIGADNG